MTDSKKLTVTSLRIRNYARIKAADITPNPTGVVLLRGDNEQGKSTIIGSMAKHLSSKSKKALVPIRVGESEAEVVADLGEFKIVERWKAREGKDPSHALEVLTAEGHAVKKPATFLSALSSKSADPQTFLAMSGPDQVKLVLELTGMDVELGRLEAQHGLQYEERLQAGREAIRLEKTAETLAQRLQGVAITEESVSMPELLERLRLGNQHNSDRSAMAQRVSEGERVLQVTNAAVEELTAELLDKTAKLARMAMDHDELVKRFNSMAPAMNTAETSFAIEGYEERSRLRQSVEQARRAEQEAKDATEAHIECDLRLGETREEILKVIGAAHFPVEGMSYDLENKVLLLNDLPFEQASQSQRLKAACRITMAGDPDIAVLFMRDGSLLGSRALEEVHQDAIEYGFQVWVEYVDENPEGEGVWIEDGTAHSTEHAPGESAGG